jgi:hypothetical protein
VIRKIGGGGRREVGADHDQKALDVPDQDRRLFFDPHSYRAGGNVCAEQRLEQQPHRDAEALRVFE